MNNYEYLYLTLSAIWHIISCNYVMTNNDTYNHIITMYGHGCFGWSRWTYFGGYCACEWCKTYLHDLSQRGNLAATLIWCACCCQARMLEHPPLSLLIFPAINLHLVHCIFELAVASHVWLPEDILNGAQQPPSRKPYPIRPCALPRPL